MRAQAVEGLADGSITAGLSVGGGMAEFVATVTSGGRVLMLSGALALDMIGVDTWPGTLTGSAAPAGQPPMN